MNFVGTISPAKGLFYSAILNGIAAPPLIIMLLLICNNPAIIGERRNTRLSDIVGSITVLVMSGAITLMLWVMSLGKATP
jgi:Mn2+/Fe2+ NRAMP family transporter